MAKEWDKFQADYKKLAPKIKTYTLSAAQTRSKRVKIALSNADQGQDNLSESMVTARASGVTGKALNDFAKDSSFKEALKLFDVAVSDFQSEFRGFEAFCEEAGSVIGDVEKLQKSIEKDLKKRKDKSATKKDIEGLLDQTEDDKKELTKCSKAFEVRLNKKQENYVANFQKYVAEILKQAPEMQEAKKEETELPQLFVDRNIKKNFSKAIGLAKKVDEHCDAAEKAAEEDLKAAAPHLKNAKGSLVELKEIHDKYEEAVKKKSGALEISKDKAKIEKMIKAISKSYETAERKFRGSWTTIKKSG